MSKIGVHALGLVMCFQLLKLCSEVSAGNDDIERKQMRVIADAMLQNRESFTSIKCTFRVAYGKADSKKHAIAEGPVQIKGVADGVWMVNEGSTRYELNFDPDLLRAEPRRTVDAGKGRSSRKVVLYGIKLRPLRMLWDGSKGIRYSARLHGCAFIPSERTGPGIQMTPFDMVGMMGRDERFHPSRLIIRSFHDDMVSCSVNGIRKSEGREYVVLVAKQRYRGTSETTTDDYWLDPERSFLPIRLLSRHSNPKHAITEVVVTDVRACSDGRWFPMRTVKVVVPGKDNTSRDMEVFQIEVTSLDVDTPPSEDQMAIQIPAGTRMHDNVHRGSQIGFKTSRTLAIGDLDWLAGKMEEAHKDYANKEHVSGNEATSQTKPRNIDYWGVLVANAVLVLLLAALIIHRRHYR